jgi:predicted Zn-ribbon and HTH transcriptional regulator
MIPLTELDELTDFKTYECKRCGHKWIPRVESPVACPKCHSAKWDTEPK